MNEVLIVFRDKLGTCSLVVPDVYFHDGKAFCTTLNGIDHTIPAENLIEIHALQ